MGAAEYVAIGWSRRPDGGNLFRNTRRHLRIASHTGTGVHTVCGIRIHPTVVLAHLAGRESVARPSTEPLWLLALLPGELAQEPPCKTCYTRAGLPAE